jgi:hypothetical protein
MTDQTLAVKNQKYTAEGSEYEQAISLALPLMHEVAEEIGGDPANAPLARDLRLTLMIGYLHSRLVNARFPWASLDGLRTCVVESTAQAVENCLLHGPVKRFDY